ncbi:hypothetical protein BDV97DRAFT_70417 [Delphinella strobiligena]|nr:hypothetical protein BDV97DRAFT_70417 [Delphinella strobiligena]
MFYPSAALWPLRCFLQILETDLLRITLSGHSSTNNNVSHPVIKLFQYLVLLDDNGEICKSWTKLFVWNNLPMIFADSIITLSMWKLLCVAFETICVRPQSHMHCYIL